jgi:hypoxanthine phosphoribosyltransferase
MEIGRVFLEPDQIRKRVEELAEEIAAQSQGMDLVLVGALRGAFVFLADLMRAMPVPVSVDFVAASSYGSSVQSSGDVRIIHDLKTSVAGRDVVLVEDIVDSGYTLQALRRHIQGHHPETFRACALLSKPNRRVVPVQADWIGFEIPDEFVVGYGLDFAERYRDLPYLAILQPEAASSSR